ncbi:MAG: DNA topoisomerase (ATP-hydrolyzing) [Lachnospiraceae bacterium]|nr:DNA topoisomerase (ATP-hydrolyzing) [Lachnospiraceae bacterium]
MPTTVDRIIRTDYSEIMQKNYIDYAMSVIVSRALPDVRDGLKPVQRRVLYDMWELGTKSDRPYRKCARIVGDTMGKYHPHGDSSIYDALVVMSQDFKKGRVLVDGHGNFGSIEGDGAAAMRYTEARLEKFTEDVFLSDLDQNIIDFLPNFDETEKEPSVLPARLPNILINGSEGIAVGMATSIPPHNIGEVIDAVIAMIQDSEIDDDGLLQYIKGPDFPVGGIVVNKDDIPAIYKKGSGKLRIRGKAEIEKGKGGRSSIVITEIPYTMIGAGIGKFMSDVAALAESRQAPEISDISNQSSKEGVRIVIDLKKGADAEQILQLLYKKTRLEDTFGVNMLVVSNGRPETMSLRQIVEAGVDFQFEIADRKYENLLASEMERKEVQEGLIKATDVIDLIIEILRGSKNRKMATECLVYGKTEGINFKTAKSRKQASALMFTERQANAILDMRLVKLIGLEIEALMKDHDETLKKIAFYQDLLENHDSMAKQLIKELRKMKTDYAVPRRTSIENAEEIVLEEKKIEEEEVVFCLDRFGYAKVLDLSVYEKNKETVETENRTVIRIMNTDKICLFTNKGKMHAVKVLDIPQKRLRDKGVPIDNLSNYSSGEEDILYIGALAEISAAELLFVTKKGMVKRTPGSEFVSSVRTIQSTKLQEDDELLLIGRSDVNEFAVLNSTDGYFLRFALTEVPELKKTAVGVRGMLLGEEDSIQAAYLLESSRELTIDYRGGKLSLNRLKLAKRGTKGTKSRR